MKRRPIYFALCIFALVFADARVSQGLAGDLEDCKLYSSNPDKAIAGCSGLLNKGKKSNKNARAAAYYFLGSAYYTKRQYDKAISNFTEALKLNPKQSEAKSALSYAYYNRGTTVRIEGHAKRAVQDLTNAIKYNPDFAEAYVNRGLAWADLREKDLAIADYSKAIGIGKFQYDKNGLRNAYYNRGIEVGSRKEFDKAISDFSMAIKLKPDDAAAYNNRGMTYAFSGKRDKAIADLKKALQIDPSHAKAKENLENLTGQQPR